jgi:PAT family beta-lactamase induction signal transducer AmpG
MSRKGAFMAPTSLKSFMALYIDRRMLIILLLGFCGGLPYLLYSSTLSYWMAQEGIDLKTIGLFSLASFPAAFKFLWAPLMDRLKIPFLTQRLGLRRSWLFVSQILSTLALCLMSLCDPRQGDIELLALSSVLLSVGAASQNIMILTYQVERLGTYYYGAAEAVCVFGYRMGLLLGGAGALYLSVFMTWKEIYELMAWCSLIGIATTLAIQEPCASKDAQTVALEKKTFSPAELKFYSRRLLSFLTWIHGAVICPFKVFMTHKGWAFSLGIMLLYKIGDHLIGSMTNIFYKDIGYSATDIANASKIFSMWAAIVGGIVGGYLLSRTSIYRALFLFGLLHACTFFLYIIIAYSPPNLFWLYLTCGCENFTGGMGLTALFSYQLMLANRTYATTQLALMTSFANMGRSLFAAPAGYLVSHLHWSGFYILAAILSFLVLPLIYYVAQLKQEWNKPLHA